MEIFLQANRERYEALVEEADEYIRRVAADYNFMEMFVSFSGGKDSTVVSDLVGRVALETRKCSTFLVIRHWNFHLPMNM